jgi:triacylglycerol lipase
MRPIERMLRARGYDVLNLGYPSRTRTIAKLAATVAEQILAWRPDEPVDFVTHSLGGILLRHAVASGALPATHVRRVVMLGPPNAGSELADQIPTWPLFGWIYRRMTGPAGMQLGTGADAVPAQLPAVTFETGIVAGTRSYNPVFSSVLGAPSDGKVRVERTRVAGMRDFLEVPYWHPLLMRPAAVHEQVGYFLEYGRFEDGGSGRRRVSSNEIDELR